MSRDEICTLIQEVKDLDKMNEESFFQYCIEKRLNDSLKSYQDTLRYENKHLLYKCSSVRSLIKLLEISG